MEPTNYPDINDQLATILSQMQAILGARLVGLYLYGSLVMGDYDEDTSDIDLLAATATDLTEAEFNALDQMHTDFVRQYPERENRLEIAYLSLHALQTFKTQTSTIAVISPGEPFHLKEEGIDYLINWYIVREKGITLLGPPPQTIIAPISKEEFIENIRNHVRWWRTHINEVYNRGSQAYAILTMCRGLYTHQHGEQLSKLQAARWAQQAFPEWASLIQNALIWRKESYREENVDHIATLPETRRFVHFAIDRILAE